MIAITTQHYTESAPILTSICSGTASTQCHQNIVWLVPYTTRPEAFVPALALAGKRTSSQGSGKLQVPNMGSQQNKAQDQISWPKQQQKRHQYLWKQHYKQPETLYGSFWESLKKVCNKHGVQGYFRGGKTIRNLLVAPRIKISCSRKVESYTDINVIRWSVMKKHWRVFKNNWREVQRTLKVPFPSIWSFQHLWSYYLYRKFQHSGEGGPEPHQNHQRSIKYKS